MGRRCAENKLKIRWDKFENDFMIFYPKKCDGHLAYGMLSSQHYSKFSDEWEKSFKEELEDRGYDLTTLKFEIQKKEEND